MIIRYRTTLQDYADRRKKLRPHDDGQEVIVKLAQGLIVVAFGLLVIWIALGAR